MKILFRLLVFPAIVVTVTISSVRLWFKYLFNYLRYGGEFISYTEKTNRVTVLDVYNKIQDREFISTE